MRSVLAGPDQVRLELDVDGVGALPGVADPGSTVVVGAEVGLRVHPQRVAVVPASP